METNFYRLAVGGVCFHNDSVLLLKRRDDAEIYPSIWELPSGGVDSFETPIEALVREVFEETGLRVDCGLFVGYFTYTSFNNTQCIQVNHICRIQNNQPMAIKLSNEHVSYKWVYFNDIIKYHTSGNVQRVLKHARLLLEKGIEVFP